MSVSLSEQLSRLTVVMACEMDADGVQLLRHLQRTRATVRHVWPLPKTLGENADLVLVDNARAWRNASPGTRGGECRAGGSSAATRPVRSRRTPPHAAGHRAAPAFPARQSMWLSLALDHFSYAKRQRLRIAELDENIKALRDIEGQAYYIDAEVARRERCLPCVARHGDGRRAASLSPNLQKLIDAAGIQV